MTSDAWDKAVEAGAIALCRIVHPGRFANGFDYWNSPHAKEAMKSAFRLEAGGTLRAAFPILGEDLVTSLTSRADQLEAEMIDGHLDRVRADELREQATALRARIDQMKEHG